MLMNVHHLHVVKYVPTLLEVTSALVMMAMNWTMMEELVMVCIKLRCLPPSLSGCILQTLMSVTAAFHAVKHALIP